ncbi:MAG: NADP(H)-dependent aldo-keto reductase [Gammaproteobacteria bacterium]|nr:NADP(H)-dependent aldo-keto reductase [Gammaproteobacteria bacterium]MBU1775596.1 NADP(H)-dependent aldo-keto reductase [Gammaproteobacteria bacterium]MBU1967734.1 NADP(H)-dependent aldo-keto reductase [Gammaproteobacteria bacterium]
MEYRRLGASDLQVSALALGTMTFGEQNSEADAHAQLDYAVARGVNFIDTAEMYPVAPRAETVHRTESYIGNWLMRQQRDKLVVATKIAGPARGFTWIRGTPRIDRAQINAAIDGSLRRLQTDYVDLYQIHWPDRYVPMFGATAYDVKQERDSTPIAEQLQALAELVKAGKVRYLGLSNETPWGVAEFVRCAEQLGLPRIVSIQNAYHLMNRTFESGLAEICHRADVGLLAYSPLAFGWLTGKYIDDPQAHGRITLFPNFGQRYAKVNVPPAVREYMKIAQEAGLSPATMALAFARTRWFTSSVILGATTLDQLKENLDSMDVILKDEVLEKIEAVHRKYPNPAP